MILSCSASSEHRMALQRAISVMNESPDSALHILDSLKEHERQFERHFLMQCCLHRTNALNKLDTLFHTTEETQQLVDYFDSHGTCNEKMLAYYLLGRAYYDTGESPMALRCFQDAVSKANTTDTDFDYAQLSRVYGQMGNIFWVQKLWQEYIKNTDIETKYAWKGKDTLNALLSIASKVHVYNILLMPDSANNICENVSESFRKHGYRNQSAGILSAIITNLITQGKTKKAKHCIDIYEAESGFFDSDGNIEQGREVYYYSKGLYYLAIDKYDSAEYWFRKELHDGKDFNNQNAASRGLAQLFQKTNRPDSAAKYALYSYEMNDSCYDITTTEKINEIQAMYNYTRSQELVQKEKDMAALATRNLWITLAALILVTAVAINIIASVKREKSEKERKYQNTKNELAKTQIDLIDARSNETAYKEILCKMEKNVEKLNKEITEYNKNNASTKKSGKERLIVSDGYKALNAFMVKGQTLTDENIEICHKLTIEYFPEFYEFISSQRFSLNKNEFNTCVLIRLYVKPNIIGYLLDISPAYVSKMRSDMLYKLFGIIGKPKEFDEILQGMN